MFVNILSSLGSFILDILETLVVSLAIFVVTYVFVAQVHQVKGDSMLNNFRDGEQIITNKLTYKFREPKRGDVIVFKYPNAPQYDYIKRIIGLPRESIQLTNGLVKIYNQDNPDGFLLSEVYIDSNVVTTGKSFLADGQVYKIPDNDYFVMGDNRERSSDSRQWGPLPYNDIIGTSWVRYWPPQALALIESPKY